MRPSPKYVGVALVAGALVLGCGWAGKRAGSSQMGQDANAAASPAPTLTLDLGDGVTMELVLIPAGEFVMGSPASEAKRSSAEGPQHRVRITEPFYMSKYEVTQSQYERVMGTNPSKFKGPSKPVEQVSWSDATEFCQELWQRTGRKVGLPTEAEWEYACRAGTTTPFHYGSSLGSDQANFLGQYPYGGAAKGTFRKTTTSVGSFAANAWELHDMHGNVSEWCSDWYDKDYYAKSPGQDPLGPANEGYRGHYAKSPGQDPLGPANEGYRVLRGGSHASSGYRCRSAYRIGVEPSSHSRLIGFRVVASPWPGR